MCVRPFASLLHLCQKVDPGLPNHLAFNRVEVKSFKNVSASTTDHGQLLSIAAGASNVQNLAARRAATMLT
jgi:hypothetical protein